MANHATLDKDTLDPGIQTTDTPLHFSPTAQVIPDDVELTMIAHMMSYCNGITV